MTPTAHLRTKTMTKIDTKTKTDTNTGTDTKTKTECLKDPAYAIFLRSRGFKDIISNITF